MRITKFVLPGILTFLFVAFMTMVAVAAGKPVAGCPRGAGKDGLSPPVRGTHVRSDHRDLVRSPARHDVGRREQSRRGLRDRVVTPANHSETRGRCEVAIGAIPRGGDL